MDRRFEHESQHCLFLLVLCRPGGDCLCCARSFQPFPGKPDELGISFLSRFDQSGVSGALKDYIFQPPDARIQPAYLSAERQAQLRASTEEALFDPAKMQELMGDGTLGEIFPTVFGSHERGGIVGRPQHGGHEFAVDVHTLNVLKEACQNPELQKLTPKDQVNVLWATLLHDIGKSAGISDPGHEWASAKMAWGVLVTMGYEPVRIQRIANLICRHTEMSFRPGLRQTERLQDPELASDLAVFYRHPSALCQLRIINQSDIRAINSSSSYWTPEVQLELNGLSSLIGEFVETLVPTPLLTTALPQSFGVHALAGDYAVLVHASPQIENALVEQPPEAQWQRASISSSLVTAWHHLLYGGQADFVAIVSGPPEHIAQASRNSLDTGAGITWADHVKLAAMRSEKMEQTIADVQSALLSLSERVSGVPTTVQEMTTMLAQYDSLTELNERGMDDPLVLAHHELIRALTTDGSGSELQEHNEVKLVNPTLVGLGVFRRGRLVCLEDLSPESLAALNGQAAPLWLIDGAGDVQNSLVIPAVLWREMNRRGLPIVSLE